MALNFILALPFAYLSIQSGGQSPGGKFGQYPDAEKPLIGWLNLGQCSFGGFQHIKWQPMLHQLNM